jgi:tetratricopeptide (TPR) repeat protein
MAGEPAPLPPVELAAQQGHHLVELARMVELGHNSDGIVRQRALSLGEKQLRKAEAAGLLSRQTKAILYYDLGRVFSMREVSSKQEETANLAAAVGHYSQSINFAPSREVHIARGWAREQQRLYQEARMDFAAALKMGISGMFDGKAGGLLLFIGVFAAYIAVMLPVSLKSFQRRTD